jgi:putative ubiquitin-RnfH superfamily antitoxin RatB of RatAB toxin-antitoxin module
MAPDEQAGMIAIEVAAALPDFQQVVKLSVAPGTTARAAVGLSGLQAKFPNIDFLTAPLGIWCREVEPQQAVKEGDRVEVYRPLAMDPREARRQLAAQGKVMGTAGRADDRG